MKYDEYVNSNENIKDLCAEIDQLRKEKKELKTKYDELNDFNNSQVKKLLEQNAELKNQILGLQNNIDGQKARKLHHIKENVKLTNEVAKLKAQIEIKTKENELIKLKMRNCLNCCYYKILKPIYESPIFDEDDLPYPCRECEKSNKWELEE